VISHLEIAWKPATPKKESEAEDHRHLRPGINPKTDTGRRYGGKTSPRSAGQENVPDEIESKAIFFFSTSSYW